MRIAVLGGTGATGRLLLQELVDRGHDVVALRRDAGSGPPQVRWVTGDARDAGALRQLVAGSDAVVSALGPRRGDATLHRDMTPLLVTAMREAGVRRFVGVSGAGIDVPGDRKSRRDRVISALVRRLGGEAVRDKALEREAWVASGLDWTLVRAPRLVDGPATGRLEHSADRSPRRTSLPRADLAAFLADLVAERGYLQQAPLVAGR
ncbi:MAG: hypothetical protein AVDCRST_MAG07-2499 [uncultured Frankineae bacterium]|uniref:NAD(P)-binding domain-containing protein n=1 Tax=uncultured Frankineae bacterium TaxID=437475 RepID=A0A6J4LS70_9ACTN|nr:MAG: hypothetical protein AVDCRST_MAG07-2499 [uncultured Frankineae bacterium]